MFKQPAADQNHLDQRFIHQRDGNPGAVGHDGTREIAGRGAPSLRGGAAVDNHHLTGLNERRRPAGNGLL
jgi:hypothetical protein